MKVNQEKEKRKECHLKEERKKEQEALTPSSW